MDEIATDRPGARTDGLRSEPVARAAVPPAQPRTDAPPGRSPTGPENAAADDTALNLLAGGEDPLVQAASALDSLLPEGRFPPNTSLRIEQDDVSGRFIYQSVDNDTGEVVKQFPPEDILEILSLFRDPEGVVLDNLA